jgi:hypothetical protein
MKIKQRRGFVLLEALPALLVLMGALLISVRFIPVALETRDRVGRMEQVEARITGVWDEWAVGGGNIVVVQREADGSWPVSIFPDEGWLPFPISDSGRETLIFRREQVGDGEGDALWEISRLIPDGSAQGTWQLITRVLIPKPREAEGIE